MVGRLARWFRKKSNKFIDSIAFLPAIFGAAFLVLAILLMQIDAGGYGIEMSNNFKWLYLRDAETARTIVATVAGGLISLTVFTFSMLMVVMAQAASQMSNRMLDNILGDKVQSAILGFYIGTIVFSLYLLTKISNVDNTTVVPALSVYFLLFLTIFDIFLFVYFLHYITESFRYEQLIQRIHDNAKKTLSQAIEHEIDTDAEQVTITGVPVLAMQSGYYQGFNKSRLMRLTKEYDLKVQFIHPIGTYIIQGTPFMTIEGAAEPHLESLFLTTDFYYGQKISRNIYYGFSHLKEVALKALSPAINDPGTAVLSIEALTDLFAHLMRSPIQNIIKDETGEVRVITAQLSIEEIFKRNILPIRYYGRNDLTVKHALHHMLEQLIYLPQSKRHRPFFEKMLEEISDDELYGKINRSPWC